MCDPEDMGEAGKRSALFHLYLPYGVSHRWSGNLRPVHRISYKGGERHSLGGS